MRELPIQKIIETLKGALPDLQAVYLFGSFSCGRENNDSDVDLAVLCKKRVPTIELFDLATKLRIFLNRDVDLVDMLGNSTVFNFEIITHSKKIFVDNSSICDFFEKQAYSMYFDLNEIRKGIIGDIMLKNKV